MRLPLLVLFVFVTAISGCSVLGYRSVEALKAEAARSASFVANRSSVLVYRDFQRSAVARQNNPVGGHFSRTISELDRSTGNSFVTLTHDGRIIAHIEIEERGPDSAQVRAWWLLASAYTDCSVRKTADENLECPALKK